MKSIPRLAALALALCGAVATASAADERAEVLQAINWVENPTNHTRRGAHGELGPYQFLAKTWRLHTRKPFSLAVVREHADEIATKHYEWLKRGLQKAGVDPNPYNIALAWNSGLSAVTSGRVPMVTYNYAERVHNLVEAQRTHRAVARMETPKLAPATAPRFTVDDAAANAVQFSLEPAAPRFLVATEPLYEPVVVTEKTVSTRQVAITTERPMFTVGNVTGTGFAFVIP